MHKPSLKPMCWERTIPLAYLLATDGECADSDEINSLFEITHCICLRFLFIGQYGFGLGIK